MLTLFSFALFPATIKNYKKYQHWLAQQKYKKKINYQENYSPSSLNIEYPRIKNYIKFKVNIRGRIENIYLQLYLITVNFMIGHL